MLEVVIKKKLDNYTLETAFQLETGCLGILGASGCGKSVTLQCIAGILTPDEGMIRLDGRVLFDSERKINRKPQERRIGYLFQNYALFPNMTVAENIAAGFRDHSGIKGKEEKRLREAKLAEMLERFSLTELAGRYPKYLSGGEQQRTALARLLIGEPEVLLLDEPFSALDAYLKEGLQLELLTLIRRLSVPAVLVTHSRDEVYRLSSSLMIMDRGRAEKPADTRELFLRPVSKVAAKLTGCKNIAAALQTETECFVPEWGLRLPISPKGEKTDCIGIRAHDFVHMPEPGREENYIPVEIVIQAISEGPFEWNVTFQKRGIPKQGALLWWKVSKELLKTQEELEQITVLYIRKVGILYLRA
ncbi:MAG: ATP-binding cassette domain-containing protein [Lachnospiraceae bacterium]